jgi:hypothetical protein
MCLQWSPRLLDACLYPRAVVTADGCFFKASFERGGEAVRSSYSQFMRPAADA